jgi:hypothetical protein
MLIQKKPNVLQSIALGGAACVLTVNFTHPLELIKTRMQVSGSSVANTTTSLFRTEGVLALWKGIPAAWGREATYASIKLGGYAPMREALGANGKNAPFYLKVVAGALTGGIGSIIGNPFDVMKTLMQTNEGKSPIHFRTLVTKMYKDQVPFFVQGINLTPL